MGEFEKEVMDYIRQEMRKGFSQEEIRKELIRVGHDIEKIEKHLDHVKKHRTRKKHALLWSLIIVIIVYVILLILGDPSMTSDDMHNQSLQDMELADEGYYKKAIIERDERYCEMIENQDLKSSCLMTIKTPEQTSNTPSDTALQADIFKEAITTRDPQKCMQLTDELLKADCMAIATPNLADNAASQPASEDEPALPTKKPDQEYMSLALNSGDVNYCYEIMNKDVRGNCVNTISSLGGN